MVNPMFCLAYLNRPNLGHFSYAASSLKQTFSKIIVQEIYEHCINYLPNYSLIPPLYHVTSCKTSYNVLSHSHWGLGQFWTINCYLPSQAHKNNYYFQPNSSYRHLPSVDTECKGCTGQFGPRQRYGLRP